MVQVQKNARKSEKYAIFLWFFIISQIFFGKVIEYDQKFTIWKAIISHCKSIILYPVDMLKNYQQQSHDLQ